MKYRRKIYYEEFEDIKGAKRQTMIHKTYTQNQRSSNKQELHSDVPEG
jgi:hypothetical protein